MWDNDLSPSKDPYGMVEILFSCSDLKNIMDINTNQNYQGQLFQNDL